MTGPAAESENARNPRSPVSGSSRLPRGGDPSPRPTPTPLPTPPHSSPSPQVDPRQFADELSTTWNDIVPSKKRPGNPQPQPQPQPQPEPLPALDADSSEGAPAADALPEDHALDLAEGHLTFVIASESNVGDDEGIGLATDTKAAAAAMAIANAKANLETGYDLVLSAVPAENVPVVSPLSVSAKTTTPRAQGSLEETISVSSATSKANMDRTRVRSERVDDLSYQILGQYRLGTIIGEGMTGRVYKAQHLWLQRPCAIKVLNPGMVADDPRSRQRFASEARVIAALIHPHIVMVHNLGHERGYDFIEMEYIPYGVSLKHMIDWHGVLLPMEATEWVYQVVMALDTAHAAGLVHRDIKPANVLLAPNRMVKLADFGLVQRSDETTGAQVVRGTPLFMAPELFEGKSASPQSDFYALGVMYYQLLTGETPYQAASLNELWGMHRDCPIPDIRTKVPNLPDRIAQIVEYCLAKDPKHRPAGAALLGADLQYVVFNLRDAETLIKSSLEDSPCVVTGVGDRFVAECELGNGRTQPVVMEMSQGFGPERILTIYADCGLADPRHYELVLRLNAELTYAGISLKHLQGEPRLMMLHHYSLGQVTEAEIFQSVWEIARSSDWVRTSLSHSLQAQTQANAHSHAAEKE